MMLDISHLKKPKTSSQYKTHCKEIKKRLDFAQRKGVNYVYLCGTALHMVDFPQFLWFDWNDVDKEIDSAEKTISNFEKNLITS